MASRKSAGIADHHPLPTMYRKREPSGDDYLFIFLGTARYGLPKRAYCFAAELKCFCNLLTSDPQEFFESLPLGEITI